MKRFQEFGLEGHRTPGLTKQGAASSRRTLTKLKHISWRPLASVEKHQEICRKSHCLCFQREAKHTVMAAAGREIVGDFLDSKCANCLLFGWEQPDPSSLPLKRCTGCQKVKYCSKECQEEHWKKVHKRHCKFFSGVCPSDIRK